MEKISGLLGHGRYSVAEWKSFLTDACSESARRNQCRINARGKVLTYSLHTMTACLHGV